MRMEEIHQKIVVTAARYRMAESDLIGLLQQVQEHRIYLLGGILVCFIM